MIPKTLYADKTSNLEEYYFKISASKSIAMREIDTTPDQFVQDNIDVEAAINGSYYDIRPEGIAYLAENHHFATEKPEDVRGYFSVNLKGDKIKVAETLDGKLNDYWLVLGTHPLLVVERKVYSQAKEKRYGLFFSSE